MDIRCEFRAGTILIYTYPLWRQIFFARSQISSEIRLSAGCTKSIAAWLTHHDRAVCMSYGTIAMVCHHRALVMTDQCPCLLTLVRKSGEIAVTKEVKKISTSLLWPTHTDPLTIRRTNFSKESAFILTGKSGNTLLVSTFSCCPLNSICQVQSASTDKRNSLSAVNGSNVEQQLVGWPHWSIRVLVPYV